MAVLNSWQKLDRVLTGKPFGLGTDGAYSSATVPTIIQLSATGVATETHFHATAGQFVANDVVLIHQSRGTGVGQWEINKVTADNGDGTYTVSEALKYSYVSPAQVMKIPQYTNVTVQSGNWTPAYWNQTKGGIFALAANGTVTISGYIDLYGANGSASLSDQAGRGQDSGGYFGGNNSRDGGGAFQGEGTSGTGSETQAANGNGGGGAEGSSGGLNGGGGGGHAAAGGDGSHGSSGGVAVGSTDLTSLNLGGGGGGGRSDTNTAGGGGCGGGIVVFFAKDIAASQLVQVTGGNGGASAGDGPGAGGAGGSILLVCATASLGTNKFLALGGTAGGGNAGAGGAGRIAIHHSGTVTGTASPTFTDVTDTSLVELSASGFFAFL